MFELVTASKRNLLYFLLPRLEFLTNDFTSDGRGATGTWVFLYTGI